MAFKVGRTFAAALVMSLLIQMHIAENGYASGRSKIAFASSRDGNWEIMSWTVTGVTREG